MTSVSVWISRFFVVAVCCAFVSGFTACGDDDDDDDNDDGPTESGAADATGAAGDAAVFDSARDARAWMIENGVQVRATTVSAALPKNDDFIDGKACTNIWTQVPTGTDGRPSQDFEAAFDAFDSYGADDFEVPSDKVWTIESILVYGSDLSVADPDNANDATCYIFANDGSNTPDGVPYGTGVWDETFPGSGGGFGETGTRDLSFTPTTQPELTGGVYWLSCWVREDTGPNGQWFWDESDAADLSLAHWINPADGFGTGATDWTDIQTALGSTATGFAFEICGVEATTTTTTTTPTTTTTTIPGDDDSDDDADDDADDDMSDDDDDSGIGDDDSDDDADDDGGSGDDDDDDGGCCGC